MTTTLEQPRPQRQRRRVTQSSPAPRSPRRHWFWLVGSFGFSFLVPFLFADVLGLPRDLFYGVYAVAVAAFLAAWMRDTGLDGRRALAHNWRRGLGLGAVVAALLAFMVLRTEDATSHPDGLEFVAAIVWRGIVYGLTDGLLLSVFPILAVFAAFAGSRLRTRLGGTAVVGVLAMIASIGVTATYHLGYSDFRSEELRKPIAGDVVWSAPTLFTLSPLGAPIAHAGLHVSAVVHSYETDTYLPPHAGADGGR